MKLKQQLSLPQREVQDLMDSLLNSIRPLKKNQYHETGREGALPNSFYEANIVLFPEI
jgi:hypothetical protein